MAVARGWRTNEPCDSYFGNVCSGLGTSELICFGCGWEKYAHSPRFKIEGGVPRYVSDPLVDEAFAPARKEIEALREEAKKRKGN